MRPWMAVAACLLALLWGDGRTAGIPTEGGLPAVSTGPVRFVVDVVSFGGSAGTAHVEVYLQVSGGALRFVEQGDRYRAEFEVGMQVQQFPKGEVEVLCADGQALKGRVWKRGVEVASRDEAGESGLAVMEVFPLRFRPGHYRIAVRVKDLNSAFEDTCSGVLKVSDFEAERLVVSDIQLAYDIHRAGPRGRFTKNQISVLPAISRRFSPRDSFLQCYFEVYHFALDAASKTDSFDLEFVLLDASDKVVKQYPVVMLKKPGPSGVITSKVMGGGLDIADMPSGTYTLKARIRDNLNGQEAEALRQFFVFEPGLESLNLASDEASLERYYRQIQYIATNEELKRYRTLDPEEKLRFIVHFWIERDPTPDTPQNEFLVEHFRRIRFSDDHFQTRTRQRGSDTDKGRVYIKYGPPDDIEYHTSEFAGRPYEVWTYERYEYRKCVFLDLSGIGVFELVHSTMPGELYNPRWKEDHQTMQQGRTGVFGPRR